MSQPIQVQLIGGIADGQLHWLPDSRQEIRIGFLPQATLQRILDGALTDAVQFSAAVYRRDAELPNIYRFTHYEGCQDSTLQCP